MCFNVPKYVLVFQICLSFKNLFRLPKNLFRFPRNLFGLAKICLGLLDLFTSKLEANPKDSPAMEASQAKPGEAN